MGKRMSNRERIQRKALEAEATAREKAEKKSHPVEPAAPAEKRKKPASTRRREKLVWKVFNASAKEVASFPYPQKSEADATAEKLSAKSGQPHFVNPVHVPMEEGT